MITVFDYPITLNKDKIEHINLVDKDIKKLLNDYTNLIINVNGINLTTDQFFINDINSGDLFFTIPTCQQSNVVEFKSALDSSGISHTINTDYTIGNPNILKTNFTFNDFFIKIPRLNKIDDIPGNCNTIKFFIKVPYVDPMDTTIQTIFSSNNYSIIIHDKYFGINRGYNDLYGFDFTDYFNKWLFISISLKNENLFDTKIYVEDELMSLENKFNIISNDFRSKLTPDSNIYIGNYDNEHNDYTFKGSLMKFMIFNGDVDDTDPTKYKYETPTDGVLCLPLDDVTMDDTSGTITNVTDILSGKSYGFNDLSDTSIDNINAYKPTETIVEEIPEELFNDIVESTKENTIMYIEDYGKSLLKEHDITRFRHTFANEVAQYSDRTINYLHNRKKVYYDSSNKFENTIKYSEGNIDITDLSSEYVIYTSPLFKTKRPINNVYSLSKTNVIPDLFRLIHEDYVLQFRHVVVENDLKDFNASMKVNNKGTQHYGYYDNNSFINTSLLGWDLDDTDIIYNSNPMESVPNASVEPEAPPMVYRSNKKTLTLYPMGYVPSGNTTDPVVSNWYESIVNLKSRRYFQYQYLFKFSDNISYYFYGDFNVGDFYKTTINGIDKYILDVPHMLHDRTLIIQLKDKDNKKIFADEIYLINENSIRLIFNYAPLYLNVLMFKDTSNTII